MSNRVIKDTIWTSRSLAKLSDLAQDHFPRWILMTDDWGCFDSDSRVVKGLCYPLRDSVDLKKIDQIKRELNEGGMLFVWEEEDREWGYFVSWESHHNYCNKTNSDKGGKNEKHRRKTPEPPRDLLDRFLSVKKTVIIKKQEVDNRLEHLGTEPDKILSPIPIYIPNPISIDEGNSPFCEERKKDSPPTKKNNPPKIETAEDFIEELRPLYPRIDLDEQLRKMRAWQLTPKGRGKQLTKGRIVNWLNGTEVPLENSARAGPSQQTSGIDAFFNKLEKGGAYDGSGNESGVESSSGSIQTRTH